jgi:hypothetical protein
MSLLASTERVDLAIVTMIGTFLTGVIALVGTIVTTRAKRIGEVQEKLDEHLDEAKGLRSELAEVKVALDDHVQWEMGQKYNQPWDGVERRSGPR